ncbi:protein FraH-like [Anomalospiza imberbis]|uniref:protein FraH-like n=1 Tax=Anomalospiza imberbis TaxID=187417 RepID=UPI00358FCFCE
MSPSHFPSPRPQPERALPAPFASPLPRQHGKTPPPPRPPETASPRGSASPPLRQRVPDCSLSAAEPAPPPGSLPPAPVRQFLGAVSWRASSDALNLYRCEVGPKMALVPVQQVTGEIAWWLSFSSLDTSEMPSVPAHPGTPDLRCPSSAEVTPGRWRRPSLACTDKGRRSNRSIRSLDNLFQIIRKLVSLAAGREKEQTS